MDAFTKSLCENSELYFKHYDFYSKGQLTTFLRDLNYYKNSLDLNSITYNKWENGMKSPIPLCTYNGGLGWI